MPSARSCFNLTLFRKHITRFWPLWALYTLILAFALPLNLILLNSTQTFGASDSAARFADRTILELLPEFGLSMAVALGLLSAMAVWSYLYNNRSASLLHALPIRREGLFLTGFLAGVSFFLVPNAVIFLFTLAAEAAAGTVNLGALALWFAVQTMLCFFFFCFATFCAFLTGHIVALPAFYALLNFLAVGLLSLVDHVLCSFVFGFAGLTGAWPAAERLSPLYRLVRSLDVTYVRENGVVTDVVLRGTASCAAYAAAGVVLAGLALLLYRRRNLERAGEVVAMAWLRPVFRYGMAFCGALAFGSLLHSIFGDSREGSAFAMLAYLLLCGLLCYFFSEMLLQKSFRVFKKSWKGCAVFLLLLVAATAVLELDVTGYEKHLPEASQVESVTLSKVSALPYDAAKAIALNAYDSREIARILSLHTCTAGSKAEIERGLLEYRRSASYLTTETGVTFYTKSTVSFQLSYTMKNGREMLRSYTIPVSEALLADSLSPAALLLDLLNNREHVAGDYFPETVTASDFIAGAVTFYKEDSTQVKLTAAQAGRLYEAAMQDLEEGGLGKCYLLENRDYYESVYQNQVELTFYGVFPGWTSGTEPQTRSVEFYLRTDSVHLIAALRELDVLDENHKLVTMLEMQRSAMSEKYGM